MSKVSWEGTQTEMTHDILLKSKLKQFSNDDDGAITVFACFMVFIMIMVCGIGVDLMRNEMERTQLQAALDRGVLAAAELDQEFEARDVITDYLNKSGIPYELGAVNVSEDFGSRSVTGAIRYEHKTQFMEYLGRSTLPVVAFAGAVEGLQKVEVSLVMDISDSMEGAKLIELKAAAKNFADVLLFDPTQERVSLTLVPYAAHVNITKAAFNRLNVNQFHNYSHCVELQDSAYSSTSLNLSGTAITLRGLARRGKLCHT